MDMVTRTVCRLNVMVTLTISGPSLKTVSTMAITSLGGRNVVKTSSVEPAARARSPDLLLFYVLINLCQALEFSTIVRFADFGQFL